MTVIVNGQRRSLDDGSTVADLLASMGRDPARPGAAVAVNGEVVPRLGWPEAKLADGDRVELLEAVQGG